MDENDPTSESFIVRIFHDDKRGRRARIQRVGGEETADFIEPDLGVINPLIRDRVSATLAATGQPRADPMRSTTSPSSGAAELLTILVLADVLGIS
jgi:hypothetical protein